MILRDSVIPAARLSLREPWSVPAGPSPPVWVALLAGLCRAGRAGRGVASVRSGNSVRPGYSLLRLGHAARSALRCVDRPWIQNDRGESLTDNKKSPALLCRALWPV